MQLDPNLHRKQLLQIEKLSDGHYVELTLEIEETNFAVFNEHLKLLHEAGFIEAYIVPDIGEQLEHIKPIRLTYNGHQYLAAIRDPDVWLKTQNAAANAGNWTFGLLKDLATAYARQEITRVTGLTL